MCDQYNSESYAFKVKGLVYCGRATRKGEEADRMVPFSELAHCGMGVGKEAK